MTETQYHDTRTGFGDRFVAVIPRTQEFRSSEQACYINFGGRSVVLSKADALAFAAEITEIASAVLDTPLAPGDRVKRVDAYDESLSEFTYIVQCELPDRPGTWVLLDPEDGELASWDGVDEEFCRVQ